MQDDQANEPPLIHGTFSADALPDLFRHLCERGEQLRLQVTSDTCRYEVTFENGQPVDAASTVRNAENAAAPFRPLELGLPALRSMLNEPGGAFLIDRNLPLFDRRTMHLSGEKLQMEAARLDDEKRSPLGSIDEQLLADDWYGGDHQTVINAPLTQLSLPDLLQLFKVSRRPYTAVFGSPAGHVLGALKFADGMIQDATCSDFRGRAAFTALMRTLPSDTLTSVRQTPAEMPAPNLGRTEALLMREIMSGFNDAQDTGAQDERAQLGEVTAPVP